MIPFYFGEGERRLFGLYRPAERRRSPRRAIVLCHPWGQEYLRAHRSVCRLGSMLSAAGFDVLRFDYFGTGDAAGEMADATLSGWEADIEAAIEEIGDTTGTAGVSLAGLRLGATLAARLAARRGPAVRDLVLWDPVVDGAEYLAGLCAAPSAGAQPGAPAPRRADAATGWREVGGFPLTEALAQEFRSIELPALAPELPDRTLLVVSEDLPSHAGLRAALGRRAGAPLVLEHVASEPAWIESQHSGVGAIPVKMLQRIVEWLG